jgi:hypothetical protein
MIRDVIARHGIQAVQLTYENRVEITDLVRGRLHQHGQIDRASSRLMGFSFEIELPTGHLMRERQWLMITPEGAVSILDDDTFRSWFDVVDHLTTLESRALPPRP